MQPADLLPDDEAFIDEDVAALLAIVRDLRQSYGWDQLHITGDQLRDFYSRVAYMLEPDRKRRVDDWGCDLLDADWRPPA